MSGTRWSTHVAKPQVFANCLTSQIVDNWIQDALHECQHDDHSTLVSHAGSCQRHEPHLAVASPAMVERRRVQFKPRVSLVLVVQCSRWSYFAKHFALNSCVGPCHACCARCAGSDTDRKRTLVHHSASQRRWSQNSARLISRFASLTSKEIATLWKRRNYRFISWCLDVLSFEAKIS